MKRNLQVCLFSQPVGSLGVEAGRLRFCYAPSWLENPSALALSVSLPLRAEPFDDHEARPFFAGLLPEGQLRRLIAQSLQVSKHNDFALLEQIGGECAGAVALVESGQPPPAVPCKPEVQWLDDAEVLAVLEALPHRPMLVGQEGLRLSLAGAQDKLPVVFDGLRLGLPRYGTPSTHILKPAILSVEGSVTNEAFCMALLAAMGMNAAPARVHRVLDKQFLLVERYDRKVDASGLWLRLHQEDFCQALGTPPDMKYQSEGGPDLAACFGLLRRVAKPSAPQLLRLLDCVVVNALIGNHDAHAKNFSFLYIEKTPVLAPCYDVLSTAIYPHLSAKMAMKIGGKYHFEGVLARHWALFAEHVGLAPALVKQRVLDLAQALPVQARALQANAQQGFTGHAVVAKIIELIEHRCALAVQRLG